MKIYHRYGNRIQDLSKEEEVQGLYRLQAIQEIYEWTGVPSFPPQIRERARKRNIIIAKDKDKVIGWVDFNLCKDGFLRFTP